MCETDAKEPLNISKYTGVRARTPCTFDPCNFDLHPSPTPPPPMPPHGNPTPGTRGRAKGGAGEVVFVRVTYN